MGRGGGGWFPPPPPPLCCGSNCRTAIPPRATSLPTRAVEGQDSPHLPLLEGQSEGSPGPNRAAPTGCMGGSPLFRGCRTSSTPGKNAPHQRQHSTWCGERQLFAIHHTLLKFPQKDCFQPNKHDLNASPAMPKEWPMFSPTDKKSFLGKTGKCKKKGVGATRKADCCTVVPPFGGEKGRAPEGAQRSWLDIKRLFVTGGSKRSGNAGLRAAIRTAAHARSGRANDMDEIR
eukprot:gene12125-biopygen4911